MIVILLMDNELLKQKSLIQSMFPVNASFFMKTPECIFGEVHGVCCVVFPTRMNQSFVYIRKLIIKKNEIDKLSVDCISPDFF